MSLSEANVNQTFCSDNELNYTLFYLSHTITYVQYTYIHISYNTYIQQATMLTHHNFTVLFFQFR